MNVHWLFRGAGAAQPECMGIQVFSDGDYQVIDSPTGTYMGGHADRGKWRREYDRYLALGYVPEAEAKAAGLIPQSWSREAPSPPWMARRAKGRLWLIATASIVIALLGALLFRALVHFILSFNL
jgi:hypothetical protein